MKKKWISSKDKGWSVAGKVTQDNPNAGQTKGLTTSKGKVQPLLLPQLIFYLEQMECPCSCIDFSRSKELQGLDTVCWSQDFSEAQVTMWAIDYCHYQYLTIWLPMLYAHIQTCSLCRNSCGVCSGTRRYIHEQDGAQAIQVPNCTTGNCSAHKIKALLMIMPYI